jgi:catechol 2,3-dioxygenase-like lactoylglutathione lyase family enzyme/heme-degrading monooxygenase HmoA
MGDEQPVARIWRGATAAERAEEYVAYLRETGVAEYRATEGNRGVLILVRTRDGRAAFTVVSLWDSLDSVRGFAGDDVETAVFYPADDEFLVERELTVEHHALPVAELGDRGPVLDHVGLPVADAAASARFYDAALGALGLAAVARLDDGSVGYGRAGADDFWIRPGGGSGPLHVAFAAPTPAAVDAFHAAAVGAGGRDNGPPGERPEYHPGYYAAYVLDPDGHNVEAVCHQR